MATVTAKAPKTAPSYRSITRATQLFKLLNDETRLRIVWHLVAERELNVTEICQRIGQTQPAISHHLALMRVAGLIESERRAKNMFYKIADQHRKLVEMALKQIGE